MSMTKHQGDRLQNVKFIVLKYIKGKKALHNRPERQAMRDAVYWVRSELEREEIMEKVITYP